MIVVSWGGMVSTGDFPKQVHLFSTSYHGFSHCQASTSLSSPGTALATAFGGTLGAALETTEAPGAADILGPTWQPFWGTKHRKENGRQIVVNELQMAIWLIHGRLSLYLL